MSNFVLWPSVEFAQLTIRPMWAAILDFCKLIKYALDRSYLKKIVLPFTKHKYYLSVEIGKNGIIK